MDVPVALDHSLLFGDDNDGIVWGDNPAWKAEAELAEEARRASQVSASLPAAPPCASVRKFRGRTSVLGPCVACLHHIVCTVWLVIATDRLCTM